MTLYIGVFIGFLLGTMAGITLTAILVAARRESEVIITKSEMEAWEDHWREVGG